MGNKKKSKNIYQIMVGNFKETGRMNIKWN